MSEQSLRRKLFLARKAAVAVEKKGHNHDGDFKYAKAEDVLAEASKVLEKQSVVIVPSVESVEYRTGKTGMLAVAQLEFEVVDTKSGEALTKRWAGTGWDMPGDKALYKAITGGTKYFLASLLGIPFGSDPEDDGSTPSASDADRARTRQDRAAEAPDLVPVGGSIEADYPAAAA